MKPRILGIAFLAILWIALCCVMISATGFTLKNLFVAVASGIIIFVPLWKKYKKEQDV